MRFEMSGGVVEHLSSLLIKSRWVRDDRRGGESVGLYSSEPTNEVGAIEVPVTSDRQPTRAGVAVDLSAQGSGLRARHH